MQGKSLEACILVGFDRKYCVKLISRWSRMIMPRKGTSLKQGHYDMLKYELYWPQQLSFQCFIQLQIHAKRSTVLVQSSLSCSWGLGNFSKYLPKDGLSYPSLSLKHWKSSPVGHSHVCLKIDSSSIILFVYKCNNLWTGIWLSSPYFFPFRQQSNGRIPNKDMNFRAAVWHFGCPNGEFVLHSLGDFFFFIFCKDFMNFTNVIWVFHIFFKV